MITIMCWRCPVRAECKIRMAFPDVYMCEQSVATIHIFREGDTAEGRDEHQSKGIEVWSVSSDKSATHNNCAAKYPKLDSTNTDNND